MPSEKQLEQIKPLGEKWRPRCYGCFRPIDRCFCDRIPRIDNRTDVLIIQHMRERFHPFNTARILRRSLLNSQLVADRVNCLAAKFSQLILSSDVGLLYPVSGSILLEELEADKRPKQLVILDGTWHHTKTLFRDIPQLQHLPRYRLAPTHPSRYGLRREPHVSFLSTLEATVAALRCLEPKTQGFDELVAAFESMVEDQLSHPKSEETLRRKVRMRPPLNLPDVLKNNFDNIVVVYGESAPGVHDTKKAKNKSNRAPVVWVAERLGSSERFERKIQPSTVLTKSFCDHLELSEIDLADAVPIDTFRREWESFLRPSDTLAYYYPNSPLLLDYIGGTPHPRIYLKSIQLHREQKSGTLEEKLLALNVVPGTAYCGGRAGKRLSNTIAFLRYLCDTCTS